MKRQAIGFLLLFSLVFSISAQKAQIAHVDATEANLRKHIEYLASDKLEGRRTGEHGAMLAADYIADQFKKIGLRSRMASASGKPGFLQAFPGKGDRPDKRVIGYNVVGILDGTDPKLKNEAIVIGAHYAHLGHGGEGSLAPNSTDIHHGADDNASGTAAVIEMARQFSAERKNKRTIIFIAFSGEEEGLFGSKYYVNNPVFPIEKTVAMINLDMVGRLHDDKLTIGGIGTSSEWTDLLNTKNKRSIFDAGLTGTKQNGTTQFIIAPVATSEIFKLQLNEDGFGPSDHSSFYGKKISVLFFFTGTHLDYHKPSDTADKINYDGEARVISYITSIAKAIGQNSVRPTYKVAKSPASPGGGRVGITITLGTIPSYTDSTDGMVIDGVRDDSPAAKTGLKANDKIVKLAGQDINNIQDYTKVLGTMKAGEDYEIVIIRGAEHLTLKITPVKRP